MEGSNGAAFWLDPFGQERPKGRSCLFLVDLHVCVKPD